MSKQLTPNYEIQKQSAVFSLQDAYRRYKNAIIDSLKWTWIDDDGNYAILKGAEERSAKIKELEKEVIRLKFKVDEITGEKGRTNENIK